MRKRGPSFDQIRHGREASEVYVPPVSSKAAEAAGGEKWAIDRLKQAAHWLCDQPHHVGFLESCTVCKTNLMALKSAYDMGREQSAPAAPSERADEREKFEEWVKKDGFPDADLSQCGCADQRRFHYQDAYTDFAHRAWQARAGLSSREGK